MTLIFPDYEKPNQMEGSEGLHAQETFKRFRFRS